MESLKLKIYWFGALEAAQGLGTCWRAKIFRRNKYKPKSYLQVQKL
jgi:hypothetical protein